jgi:hypothetical protein
MYSMVWHVTHATVPYTYIHATYIHYTCMHWLLLAIDVDALLHTWCATACMDAVAIILLLSVHVTPLRIHDVSYMLPCHNIKSHTFIIILLMHYWLLGYIHYNIAWALPGKGPRLWPHVYDNIMKDVNDCMLNFHQMTCLFQCLMQRWQNHICQSLKNNTCRSTVLWHLDKSWHVSSLVK